MLLNMQYVVDYNYNNVMTEVYISSYTEGEKDNNYTLIVKKDDKVFGDVKEFWVCMQRVNTALPTCIWSVKYKCSCIFWYLSHHQSTCTLYVCVCVFVRMCISNLHLSTVCILRLQFCWNLWDMIVCLGPTMMSMLWSTPASHQPWIPQSSTISMVMTKNHSVCLYIIMFTNNYCCLASRVFWLANVCPLKGWCCGGDHRM